MAKGKRSVALFEVIQAGKKTRPSLSLRTPKWWFKRKPAIQQPSAAVEQPVAEINLAEASAPQTLSPPPGIDMKFDPDRHRITFQISYTSAIITAFAAIVIIALAYIVGSHMRSGPTRSLAGPSTEQIRKGPAHPNVLDVKPIAIKTTAPLLEADDATVAAPIAKDTVIAPTTGPAAKRMINRNYIVVQSYPDEKNANDACDLLTKNGIPCTVEDGLSNYAPGWYSVVTQQGFDHIRNNPDLDQYVQSIHELSAKFAGTVKFKKFEPQPYKWRG
ncbi:MAG TPA: hypothetical protein VKK61_08505 [Tepidisphaeraceae bacterium]|nr:hypothetical protein [Tepidisphaeraceae bacterium]